MVGVLDVVVRFVCCGDVRLCSACWLFKLLVFVGAGIDVDL